MNESFVIFLGQFNNRTLKAYSKLDSSNKNVHMLSEGNGMVMPDDRECAV